MNLDVVAEAVRRNVEVSDGKCGTGSGFVICQQEGICFVVTAFHMLTARGTPKVQGKPARVVSADPKNDLCVLSLPAQTDLVVAPPSTAEVCFGDPVFYVGNPAGYRDVLTQGYVARILDRVILLDIKICGGASGSAVWTPNKELVGVMTGAFTSAAQDMGHYGIATTTDVLITLLQGV